jgi:predicted RNase H-like HicB family nuclease
LFQIYLVFSAADSGLDEEIDQGKVAIELWIERALDRGQVIPKPSSLRDLQKTGLDAKAK